MWDKIKILLKDVDRCFTALTSIDAGKLSYRLPEPSEKALQNEKELQEAFDWLRTFISGDVETAMFIYKRHTPDTWANYLALEYATSLSEYRDLQGYARTIKKSWQGRPKILKARKHGKQEHLQEQEAAHGNGSECEEDLDSVPGL